MTSNKDNIIFEKTSFLQGGNSPFIKELYLQYLNNPATVPQSWREFFDGLNEDKETIQKEILGPSWAPKKNNTLKTIVVEELEKYYNQGRAITVEGVQDIVEETLMSNGLHRIARNFEKISYCFFLKELRFWTILDFFAPEHFRE